MKKIVIACPIHYTHKEFRESIFELNYTSLLYLFGKTGEEFKKSQNYMETIKERWKTIARARNQILENAFKFDWDYILWLDSDIRVYPELIKDLLKYTPHEKIISAEYKYRIPEKPRYVRYKEYPVPILNTINIESGGPIDVNNPPYRMWVGFGCILISREVHEKIGLWDCEIWDRENVFVGEDIIYCRKIREAGYRIFLSDIKVPHYPQKIEIPDTEENTVLPTNYIKT